MIFQCNCGQRFEISGVQEGAEFEGTEFECTNCKKTVRIPKLNGNQLLDKNLLLNVCQNCGQKYESDCYRPTTKLICQCGNVLVFPDIEPKAGESLGRRKEDKIAPIREESTQQMKKCPYCAEKILANAIKCRYCGEFLSKEGFPNEKPLQKIKPQTVAEIHKTTGKKIMLVGMLMMLGGCVSCTIGGLDPEAPVLTLPFGMVFVFVGFIICIIGRFLE